VRSGDVKALKALWQIPGDIRGGAGLDFNEDVRSWLQDKGENLNIVTKRVCLKVMDGSSY